MKEAPLCLCAPFQSLDAHTIIWLMIILLATVRLNTITSLLPLFPTRSSFLFMQRRLHTSASRDSTRRTPPTPPPPQSPLTFGDVWPALLRCLAYGSVSYFSLHLAWQYMDASEQRDKMEVERRQMEEAVREARQGAAVTQGVR